MFEKKILIYKKKDRETWTKIKDALKAAGLKGVSATHYQNDSLMAGGCGSKLDPRDFGAKGKIDRDIYEIKVKPANYEAAMQAIRESGIETIVDENATVDAAVRYSAN